LENKRVEQVLPWGRGKTGWHGCEGVQIMYSQVCKCNNDTCWNSYRNRGRGMKESSQRVSSSIIYLIYCKSFCKCHNVPPPSTTTKIVITIIAITQAQNQKKKRKLSTFNLMFSGILSPW
jgi:hypothetical protein